MLAPLPFAAGVTEITFPSTYAPARTLLPSPSGISCITRAFTTCPALLLVEESEPCSATGSTVPAGIEIFTNAAPTPEIRSNARGRKKTFMAPPRRKRLPKAYNTKMHSHNFKMRESGPRAHDSQIRPLLPPAQRRNSAFLAFRPCVILQMGHAPGNSEAK